MKKVVFAALLLSTSSALADVSSFIGRYDLNASDINGETFCYDGVIISENEESELEFYRADVTYMPLYKGVVNGEAREVSGSHGEALSSSKGKEKVTYKNGTLTFQYSGVNKFLGVPASRVQSGVSMKISEKGRVLTLTRKEFEGVAFGVGRDAVAKCEYIRSK